MTLVAVSDIPTVEIDPSALSSAAESLRNHADAVADSSGRIATTWNALTGSYDAPEAAELRRKTSTERYANEKSHSHRLDHRGGPRPHPDELQLAHRRIGHG